MLATSAASAIQKPPVSVHDGAESVITAVKLSQRLCSTPSSGRSGWREGHDRNRNLNVAVGSIEPVAWIEGSDGSMAALWIAVAALAVAALGILAIVVGGWLNKPQKMTSRHVIIVLVLIAVATTYFALATGGNAPWPKADETRTSSPNASSAPVTGTVPSASWPAALDQCRTSDANNFAGPAVCVAGTLQQRGVMTRLPSGR